MLGLTADAVIAGGSLIQGCNSSSKGKCMSTCKAKYQTYTNDDYYKADGTFDEEFAKKAFYEMFEYFHYPIVDRLKGDEFWVTDFGLNNYAEVGMGGIFWVNNLEDNYFGHDIYLMPGQRIPEHGHDKTDVCGPKMEA